MAQNIKIKEEHLMRLRKKWWARPELEASSFVITDPFKHKGRWAGEFGNNSPIYLELGCGTGRFISGNALINRSINFVGVDLKDEVLVYAKRTVEDMLGSSTENIRLIPMQISFINDVFDADEVSRIYINFCNPWPKLRHNKRRLTHNVFLERYRKFLKPGSQIWFKTDDMDLFDASQEYFRQSGFSVEYLTYDLHKSGFENNIMTEYEAKFVELGIPIKFLIAKL
jgi:tRNA (guanine-N7-)-methyltransferase